MARISEQLLRVELLPERLLATGKTWSILVEMNFKLYQITSSSRAICAKTVRVLDEDINGFVR